MYRFIDTSEVPSTASTLPTEAVSINGTWLDEAIEGYRTLYVMGRESLEAELNTTSIDTRDGELFRSRRYPARELTVGFQMLASDADEFRERFNKLNGVLNVEEAQIIFNDEPGCYFVGTPKNDADVDAGRWNVTGEFTIYCANPFKHAVDKTEVTTKDLTPEDSAVTISTDNTGTVDAYPEFEVQFGTDEDATSGTIGSKADCGYVLFGRDGTDYSIQFGDDQEADTTTKTMVSQNFKSAKGSFVDDTSFTKLGTDYTYAGSTNRNSNGLYASAYGSASKFHGPMAVYTLPTEATGAFTLSWKHVLACNNNASKYGNKQAGSLWVIAFDSDKNPVAGYGLAKSSKTSLWGACYGIHSLDKDSDPWSIEKLASVKLNYTGANGFKTTKDTAGRLSTQTIKRYQDSDGYWYINVNGKKTVCDYGEGTPPAIKHVGVYFGKYSTYSTPTRLAVTELTFIDGSYDQLNTFSSGDVLAVNTEDMSIKLNDADRAELGDVSNDWDGIKLPPGTSAIDVNWSTWVESGYEPTVIMRYRRRWI